MLLMLMLAMIMAMAMLAALMIVLMIMVVLILMSLLMLKEHRIAAGCEAPQSFVVYLLLPLGRTLACCLA